MLRSLIITAVVASAVPFAAGADAVPDEAFVFNSIDGGQFGMADWRGHPISVANTAALCEFAPQYMDLPALFDTYRAQGPVVPAIRGAVGTALAR